MTQKIWLFMDLDDTLFQTKRKREDGIIAATEGTTISYMTIAQQHCLNLFNQAAQVKIIPTTARDLRQYNNTLLSRQPDISLAILYHSGMILNQGQPDREWQQQQRAKYQDLSQSVDAIYALAKTHLDPEKFTLFNVDDYYVSIKAKHETPIPERLDAFTAIKSQVVVDDHIWQQTDRALHIFPQFLNKRYAVEYLINKHQPELTIGMGDSRTDLGFINCCDFQVFPKQSDIANHVHVS